MLKKYPFLSGTLLLTLTGIITRIIGFFYRIFLSHHIGEEGMGIYQLIAPVMALSFSLTCAGIQTSISKYTASYIAGNQSKSALRFFVTGFTVSMFLSVATACFLYQNSSVIAADYLMETRCEPLVRIYALSLPFAGIHSCINGYYYGLKKSMIPSVSQLVEQLARVGSVFAIYTYSEYMHCEPSLAVTVLGILIGEICSTALSLVAFYVHLSGQTLRGASSSYLLHFRELLRMAVPLIANRLSLNFLQSMETVHIPQRLTMYGLSKSEALANYGVLTGMTYPLILFPSAVTSSVSVLLLPYISEAVAKGDTAKIRSAIKKSVIGCTMMGSLFCIFFLLFGPFLGKVLFDSQLAGTYIQMLSIACPLLYLSGVLTSVLHGLGKAFHAFLYNVFCLLIRLGFVFFLIPKMGIPGYLIGIFVSECFLISVMLITLRKLANFIGVDYNM